MSQMKSETYMECNMSPTKTGTNENDVHLLGIINALSNDISDLYEVECNTRHVTVYRAAGKSIGVIDTLKESPVYENAMKAYIEYNVHPDDREDMTKNTDFNFLCDLLSETDGFVYHYRILRDGEVHYYYMKCARNGDCDTFSNIILAFANEDFSINKKHVNDVITPGTSKIRRQVLIADGKLQDQEMLINILQKDYDLVSALDAESAYEILRENYRNIDVVLYDMGMQECSGMQFLRKVKSNLQLSTIPVIILTDNFGIEEEICLKSGAVDCLQRPLHAAIVENRLKNVIRLKDATVSLDEIEIDELTNVYTKQAFMHHARTLLESDPEESYSIIIADIENFKLINSAYGEEKGDELLKYVAEFFVNALSNGICARYSGDQIIALVRIDISKLDKRIRENSVDFIKFSPVPNISVKLGLYENVDRELTISQMCDRALLALKSVKHNYRELYGRYNGPVSQRQLIEQGYEMRFPEAIRNREFQVYYQPKYNPYNGLIVGAEALVRWKTSNEMIPPGDFLAVFESDGLIQKLDEYVFREVCRQQKKWMDLGYELIPISVNVSRASLFYINLVEKYKKITEQYGIDPQYVPIEITESAAVASEIIKPIVDAFYENGFILHMDDFGSGQSSLNGLNLLHFDVVKLDKSLIDFIGDPQGDLILTYTIALGIELGLQIVAEGVETESQLTFLKDNGCKCIQGYYYSKALPVDGFEAKVTENLNPCTVHKKVVIEPHSITAVDHITKLAMDRMIHHLPGGFFTYEAHGNNKILSSNSYLWRLFGCDSEEEFLEFVDGSFNGMVCPEELADVQKSIARQIFEKDAKFDYVEYHICRKDGKKIHVVDYGHLYQQNNTDVYYVFISEVTNVR